MNGADRQQQDVDHDRLEAMDFLLVIGAAGHVRQQALRQAGVGLLRCVLVAGIDSPRDAGDARTDAQQPEYGIVDGGQFAQQEPEIDAGGDSEQEPREQLDARQAE
ncbi:hypothetical protein E7V67_016260 [[Empedobacter] haloabium]|uniref:Uncharacterized protein n=1 Tax=[Empedobacter] haloabium TaxID=592317 RepID=A0ABZ1UGE2_9BURK